MTYLEAKNLIRSAIPGATGRALMIEIERALRNRALEAARLNPKGWPWQRRTAWTRNAGGYEDGTLGATQDGRDVTLTDGTFPDPCAGWMIAFTESEEEIYKVESRTGASAVKINRPYEGETGSGKDYRMYDPYCRAPSDLYAWEAITLEAEHRVLLHETLGHMRGYWPKQISLAGGWLETIGPPSETAAYETGTVTVAKDSAAVTGSGTTFPEWIAGHHFQIAGESCLYRIKQWDSNTALTLDRAYGGDNAAAGKSYAIDPKGAMQLEVHYPREDQYALKIDYWAEPQQLVNDTDVLDGDETYARAVLDLATGDVLMARFDPSVMDEGMAQQEQMRIKMYLSRGMEMLRSMIESNAPIPEGDASLTDVRWRGASPNWSWMRR